MSLPQIEWEDVTIPNPRWRWWAFWRPRRIKDWDKFIAALTRRNALLDDLKWRAK